MRTLRTSLLKVAGFGLVSILFIGYVAARDVEPESVENENYLSTRSASRQLVHGSWSTVGPV